MRIESERIKKMMKKVCEKEGNVAPYNLMSEILDYVQAHENMGSDIRAANVKDLIDETSDQE